MKNALNQIEDLPGFIQDVGVGVAMAPLTALAKFYPAVDVAATASSILQTFAKDGKGEGTKESIKELLKRVAGATGAGKIEQVASEIYNHLKNQDLGDSQTRTGVGQHKGANWRYESSCTLSWHITGVDSDLRPNKGEVCVECVTHKINAATGYFCCGVKTVIKGATFTIGYPGDRVQVDGNVPLPTRIPFKK